MDGERVAARAGVIGPLVTFLTTFAATVASPTFRWSVSALSDLGAPGAANPWLFNYGLVVGMALTLPFAWALWTAAAHPLQRLGTAATAATIVLLGLVGVFPAGTDLHLPVAVAFFVGVSLTTWIHGTGTVLAGKARRGLLAIWLGIVHLLVWAGWAALGVGGIAVPEMAGAVLFYGWVVLEARSMGVVGGRPSTSAMG